MEYKHKKNFTIKYDLNTVHFKFIIVFLFFSDFSKFNGIFLQDDFNVDYTTAVEMTSELFFLEVTHRIVVCVYEVN